MSNDAKLLGRRRMTFQSVWGVFRIPLIAIITAFLLGGIVIWVTSGSLETVGEAYWGLLFGAFFKQRGLSESIVATVPYILLSLGVAVGFKSGLFNIGVEGQYYMGAVTAAFVGQIAVLKQLPAIIFLPLVLVSAFIGGAFWAAIPGFLKAKTGAHEVITTIMMNYISFRFTEFLILGPLRDPNASADQTMGVGTNAELWTIYAIRDRIQNPMNALFVAVILAAVAMVIARWLAGRPSLAQRLKTRSQRLVFILGVGAVIGVIAFFVLPPLTQAFWPFTDQYDRLHTGIFLAIAAAFVVWWLLWRTTLGFELRMVGANPNAGRYAGVNITRNIVVAMAISGGLAGLAGAVEVLGVSICRCLPLFFSSGYGFDAIAIALLANNDPFGIIAAAFLFGAMRNGADLMELRSHVSKYIISLIQALALLLVSIPLFWQRFFNKDARTKKAVPLPTNQEKV